MPKRLRDAISQISKSEAAAVTAALALPGETNPIRMRDEYSAAKTAVAAPFSKTKLNWASTAGLGKQLPDEVTGFFIFRDVLRNVVIYQRNPTNQPWAYIWIRAFLTASLAGDTVFQSTVQGMDCNPMAAYPSDDTTTYPYRPHGNMLFGGKAEDNRFIWIDSVTGALSACTIVYGGDPGTFAGAIDLIRWDNDKEVIVSSTNTVAGTSSYAIAVPSSGYYRLHVCSLNENNFQVTVTGTCACWEHHYLPGFWDNAKKITSIRMLALSFLLKNQASPLNKQGNCVAVQIGKGENWTKFAQPGATNNTFYDTLLSRGGGKDMLLMNGMYGFLKPSDNSNLEMKTPIVLDNLITQTQFDLCNNADYIAFAANCTTADGRDCYFNMDAHVEYTTGDTWTDISPPTALPESWEAGIEALASMEQFYENPVHISSIFKSIGKFAKIGSRVLSLFPTTAILGKVADIVGEGLINF